MDRPLYYGRDGRPMTSDEWVLSLKDTRGRIIGRSGVGGFYVSTVWLGLDHSFGGGPPMIFETMAWREDSRGELYGDELLQWRYATEEKAQQGHQRIIEMIEAGVFEDYLNR